eukprot:scaffold1228_cov115-Isochrysis_galbana.AAC.16
MDRFKCSRPVHPAHVIYGLWPRVVLIIGDEAGKIVHLAVEGHPRVGRVGRELRAAHYARGGHSSGGAHAVPAGAAVRQPDALSRARDRVRRRVRRQPGHQRGGGAPPRQLFSQLVADDGAKDGAVQQGVAAEAVVAVDATSHLRQGEGGVGMGVRMEPKTMQSSKELPPKRLLSWTPFGIWGVRREGGSTWVFGGRGVQPWDAAASSHKASSPSPLESEQGMMASHLPCRVQPGNDRAVVAQHRSICAHPDAAHRAQPINSIVWRLECVQRWLLRRDWRVPEGRLAKGIHASLGCSVVRRERGVDGRLQRQSRPRVHRRRPRRRLLGSFAVGAFSISQHPASQGVRAVQLDQQTLVQVVLDMLARLGGHRLVEQQHKLGRPRLKLGRHHLVPREQLVDEPRPIWPEQHAAHPAHHLAAQRLGRRCEIGGVEEARRVNLHLVHVYGARPDGHGHLHAIACCPWTICGREVNLHVGGRGKEVWRVPLKQPQKQTKAG